MNKQSISFKADEQKLIKTGGIEHYASNIVAYIEATFDLGANWSGYDSVRAVWSNDYLTDISTVLDNNGKCIVPTEVLTDTGNVTVNLVGSIADGDTLTDRLTTYPCKAVIVDADAKVEGDETESITPSQFEQFVEIVHDEVEQVTGMTAEAETLPAGSDATASYSDGVLSFGIPKGDKGAKGDTGNTGATGNGIQSTVLNADYTLTITFTDGTSYTTPSIRGEQGPAGPVSDVTVNGTSVVDQNGVAVITMPELVKTVQGNPIVIDDAFGDVKNLTVELLPIQEGSGTPSPQNVRPITGHDSVTVGDTGKNIWGGLAMAQDIANALANANLDTTNKTVDFSTDNTDSTILTSGMQFKENTQYTYLLNGTGAGDGSVNLMFVYTDGTTDRTLGRYWKVGAWTSASGKTVAGIAYRQYGSTTTIYYELSGLFEGVLTMDDFAPFKSQFKTVTLPHTVYGAGVGVTSGESKETWQNIASYNGETISEPWLSSMDEYVQGATPTTGAQVTYKLATPTDLSTTPTSLTLYNGDNVISSDGDITMDYVQDMATVIRKIENQL